MESTGSTQRGRPYKQREAYMVTRGWKIAAVTALLIGSAMSLALNVYGFLQPPTVIGVADSKAIGHGWDARGDPVTTYTVSLSLVKRDDTNNIPIGGTLGYIIDKADFERIRDGAVIEGRPRAGVRLDILSLIHAKTFETGHSHFYRN